jgi:rhodanese-related sulfurtransferase
MALTVADMMAAAKAVVPTVTPAETQALIDQGALVVDLRDSAEIAASGKIKGAVAVGRGLLEFKADSTVPSHDPAFRKDRTVVVYCASGGRAFLAGKTLKDMGFADVRNLGGFKSCADAGGAVER